MSRLRRMNPYQLVSEFNRDRNVAYRECRLSFRDIALHNDRNPITVMRIGGAAIRIEGAEEHYKMEEAQMANYDLEYEKQKWCETKV
ncbi:hypothetical protein TNCV_4485851 [Trichonephila clavipes]|nr:hypothetical protein TNCV_4485851 [Trichonephila clavipes]